MITVYDSVLAVANIYKNTDFSGYALKQGRYDPKNGAVALEGYHMGLYQHLAYPKNYIISFRGSAKGQLTKDWVVDDRQIGQGQLPDRANDALDYTRFLQEKFRNVTIILAGHSLGGWLAQYCGLACSLPFITYNAPPCLGTWAQNTMFWQSALRYKQGLNFRVKGDPVSKAPGTHIGPVVTLKVGGWAAGGVEPHGKKACIEGIEQSGYGGDMALTRIARFNS